MSEQQITDNGREGKYFHLMVNMADDDLNVYQYRLYGHYKRVCGESADGVCWEGTRTTAKKCQMSVGKVTSTRRELVDLGYIQITAGAKDETLAITLQDMMETNVKRYAKRSPHEHTDVHHMNTDVHHMNTLPVEGCSPHEPKNNSLLQEPSEERARADDDDKHAVEYAAVGNTNSTTPSKKVSAGGIAKTPPPPRSAAPPAPKDFDDVPKHDRLDIIRAWAKSLSIEPANAYSKEANHRSAAEIFRAGYRASQVALFVKAKMQDDWWHGKTLTLAKVAELMPEYLHNLKAKPAPIRMENRAPLYPPAVRLTPEQIAQRRADKDRILAEYR